MGYDTLSLRGKNTSQTLKSTGGIFTMITPTHCKVEDCLRLGALDPVRERYYLFNGMCRVHYRRLKKYGDPLGGRSLNGTALKHFFNTYKNDTEDCIIWVFSKFHSGHGSIRYNGKCTRVHRLAMQLLVGKQPADKPEVMHLCNTPACYNVKHLVYGTHAENMAYMSECGRAPVGEKCGTSKLTEKQAKDILVDERLHKIIAKEYAINPNTVWSIKTGRSWKYLQSPRE